MFFRWIAYSSLFALNGCLLDARNDVSHDVVFTESITEIAGATIAGVANATDAAPLSGGINLCPVLSALTCDATKTTLTANYSGCALDPSNAVWGGSEVLTFASGACANSFQSFNGQQVVRTFGPGTSRSAANGISVLIDSATPTGYDTTVAPQPSGGSAVTFAGGGRSATVLGVHYYGIKAGKMVFDHTVSSGALTITGTGAAKQITGGGLTVQHNTKYYTGRGAIQTALTFSANCCHPTGGAIQLTRTGTLTGTETITYGPACGQATLSDSLAIGGQGQALTLNHCL